VHHDMVSALKLAATVFCTLSAVFARSSTGSKVLVVLEPQLSRDDYSTFFSGLESRGYELTFRAPKDVAPAVLQDDVAQFNHVIVFAPTAKTFSPDLSPQTLLQLLNKQTNLLIAVSSTHTPMHGFAAEFGLTTAPAETALVSHFAKDASRPHTTLEIALSKHKAVSAPGTVLYSGTAYSLNGNPLQVPILRAPPEAYAVDTDTSSDENPESLVEAANKGGDGLWAGETLGVVVGFQARNGARVAWTGGVSLFSDKFAQANIAPNTPSANKVFAQDITMWAFQETLVYRVDNVSHHVVGETAPREHYTTNDQLEYAVTISRYDADKVKWVPHNGLDDLQLEFTMLDPHVRVDLPALKGGKPGTYSTRFRAPDRHGVFKFILDWRRSTGESYLQSSTTIPIVPPHHDGYPRFLSAAWPYYVGAISTSAAFLLFSALWLGGDVREAKKAKTE